LEKSKANRHEPLRNFILEANTAEKWVSDEDWLKIKEFLQRVGSNRLLCARTLIVAFQETVGFIGRNHRCRARHD